jgi:hypothetical protein
MSLCGCKAGTLPENYSHAIITHVSYFTIQIPMLNVCRETIHPDIEMTNPVYQGTAVFLLITTLRHILFRFRDQEV